MTTETRLSAKEALQKAREYLAEPKHWTKGDKDTSFLWDYDLDGHKVFKDDYPGMTCALGGLAKVLVEAAGWDWNWVLVDTDTFILNIQELDGEAAKALYDSLPFSDQRKKGHFVGNEYIEEPDVFESIYVYNDRNELEDVLALFDAAIQSLN